MSERKSAYIIHTQLYEYLTVYLPHFYCNISKQLSSGHKENENLNLPHSTSLTPPPSLHLSHSTCLNGARSYSPLDIFPRTLSHLTYSPPNIPPPDIFGRYRCIYEVVHSIHSVSNRSMKVSDGARHYLPHKASLKLC